MEMREASLGTGLKDTYAHGQLLDRTPKEQLERKEKNQEQSRATGALQLEL